MSRAVTDRPANIGSSARAFTGGPSARQTADLPPAPARRWKNRAPLELFPAVWVDHESALSGGGVLQVHERPVTYRTPPPFGLAAAIAVLLGTDVPIAIECYDGSRLGPPDSATRIVVRSPKALRYVLTAPGDLGFARAYVAGEIDLEGDVFEALQLRDLLPDVKVTPREWLALARTVGVEGL